jgi:hypothetical protein
MRFYKTHVIPEFHRVRPKRFLKLWYVWGKLWTYLAPILISKQTETRLYKTHIT